MLNGEREKRTTIQKGKIQVMFGYQQKMMVKVK